MSLTPLTDKALEKLRGLADGNHLDPTQIQLLGSDERTLTVHAEILFTLDLTRQQTCYVGTLQAKNLKLGPEQIHKVVNISQVEQQAAQLKKKTESSDSWAKEMDKRLKAMPGEGWGVDGEAFALEGLAQLYYTEENCGACKGHGSSSCGGCGGQGYVNCQRCQATGLELCVNCNGSGLNPAYPDQYCAYCHGAMQMHCRDCNGTRQVACMPCKARGQMVCASCNGSRRFTTQEIVVPSVRCDFRIPESGDLPSGFRRAVSRAGFKKLAQGHASIKAGMLLQREKTIYVVPYTATLPYAELRLRVAGGRAVGATVLGHKGLLLDVAPFLDIALEPVIAAYEKTMGQRGLLKKTLETKALHDAFTLFRQGETDPRALRRFYPAALSSTMMARLMALVTKLVAAETKTTRLIAGGVVLALTMLASFLIIKTGVRLTIAQHAAPFAVLIFDMVIMALLLTVQKIMTDKAGTWQLQRLFGKAEKTTAQKTADNMIGLGFGIASAVCYATFLFFLHATPSWIAILHKPL